MKRRESQILSRVLPIVFWTLAVAGSCAFPFILSTFELQPANFSTNYWWGFVVTGVVLSIIVILQRLDRFEIAISKSFAIAFLLGLASYWLPTALFLAVPVIIFLVARNHFNMRSFTAMMLGYATIAVWATVFIFLGWINNSWTLFFAPEMLWGWVPLGSVLLAWVASTIARQILRVR